MVKRGNWAPFCLPGALAAAILAPPALAQQQDSIEALRRAVELQGQRLAEQQELLRNQQSQIEAQARDLERLRNARAVRPAAAPSGGAGAAGAPGAALPVAAPSVAARPAQPAVPPAAAPSGGSVPGGSAPIGSADAQVQQRREEARILQTDPGLARTGGVLTPRGVLSLEPAGEYSTFSQSRAFVSGFTIIPGITFGSVDIREVQRRTLSGSATVRLGVTDRLEVNARVPYLYRFDTTTTQAADTNAAPITINPTGSGIGDVEFGGSYQINTPSEGAPIFIGNLRLKANTGRSPFEVPIYTSQDTNQGNFLRGLERELPTGTGFWTIEPGLTMAVPVDPAVLFLSARYLWNLSNTVSVQNPSGGARTRVNIDPGDGIGLNFGIGIALNETTSFSMGYEHVHVLPSYSNGRRVAASTADIGTFNFGLSYRLSERLSINLGFGIGATAAAPDMRFIVRVPYRFNLF